MWVRDGCPSQAKPSGADVPYQTVDEALEASGYAGLRELLEERGDEAKSLLRKLTTITERAKPKVWELRCCGIIRESIGV